MKKQILLAMLIEPFVSRHPHFLIAYPRLSVRGDEWFSRHRPSIIFFFTSHTPEVEALKVKNK